MENKTFDIEKFNPAVTELKEIAESYKGLKIKDSKDITGIEIVKKARKDLGDKRIFIKKELKLLRDGAIQFQKDVIEKEKELVGIIEPVEQELKDELERIKMEEELEKRKEYLPIMKDEVQKMGLDYDDEFLLSMNFGEFQSFLNTEKARLYEEQQEKIREQQAKEAREKEIEEAKKQAVIEEQNRAEREKIEEEKRQKEIVEQKKKEQERLEKEKSYKEWLETNKYNDSDFIIIDRDGKKKMYKFISEYEIK